MRSSSGRELQHQLLFALYADDAVGIAENVGAKPDFQAVFVAVRLGLVGCV